MEEAGAEWWREWEWGLEEERDLATGAEEGRLRDLEEPWVGVLRTSFLLLVCLAARALSSRRLLSPLTGATGF